jgi:glucoamylase
MTPSVIHWSTDDWKTIKDAKTGKAVLGIYSADLATESLPKGKAVKFTFFWPEASHWEGKDFVVHVDSLPRHGPS